MPQVHREACHLLQQRTAAAWRPVLQPGRTAAERSAEAGETAGCWVVEPPPAAHAAAAGAAAAAAGTAAAAVAGED